MTKEHAGSGFNSFKIAVGSGGNKVRDADSSSGNWNCGFVNQKYSQYSILIPPLMWFLG